MTSCEPVSTAFHQYFFSAEQFQDPEKRTVFLPYSYLHPAHQGDVAASVHLFSDQLSMIF